MRIIIEELRKKPYTTRQITRAQKGSSYYHILFNQTRQEILNKSCRRTDPNPLMVTGSFTYFRGNKATLYT